MKFIIASYIIHLTLNIYILYKGLQIFKSFKTIRCILYTIFFVDIIMFLLISLIPSIFSDKIIHCIRLIDNSNILFAGYLSAILLIFDLIFYIYKNNTESVITRSKDKIKAFVFFISILFISVVMIRGSYNFNHPQVSNVDITINKKVIGLDSIRIVNVGDTHFGSLITRSYAKRFVDLIMSQKPDIILMTGDIIDAKIEPVIKEEIDAELHRLKAKMGVFTCTGNHEYRYEAEEKIKWINDAGINVLRDSAILINNSFYVVGREDPNAPSIKTLPEILKENNVDKSKPIIVIKHNPKLLDEEVNENVDLAIYGHTHDGQVFPLNLITKTIFQKSHGYLKKKDTNIYVTSGLGIAGPQYRIGTVSEITVINMKFKK